MSNTWKILAALGGVVVLIALWVMGTYNSLVTLDESVNEKWAAVETQYQRRFDLIPNLVSTVQGSANFEQSTLTAVTEARSAWAQSKSSGDISGQIEAANSFDSALSRLLVTVEAYPEIKSTEAFLQLNDQLEGTENRISFAREEYNTITKDYNITVRRFPATIIASFLGFDQRTMFESSEGAENAIDVNFDFNTQPAN